MKDRFLVAAIQLTSTDDVARNLDRCETLVREAAARGAELVGLPENFAFMGDEKQKLAVAEPLTGPSLARLGALAAELRIHLVAGGFAERAEIPNRVHNTAVLFGPDGARLAAYRKIHLFDVDLASGERYRESDAVAPGGTPVVVETALGRIGLSICYDLRFPELYRALANAGAELVLVPAAFTMYTGKDHWHALLRARAIENQCYVLAPAQFGQHNPKRATYGKSLLVDPWGIVVAQARDGEGVVVGEVDRATLERVRADLPALRHRRLVPDA
jgi:predicted amidohydrolase